MENKDQSHSNALSIPLNTDLNKLPLNQLDQNEIWAPDTTPILKTIEGDPIFSMLLDAARNLDFEDIASEGKVREYRKDFSQASDLASRKMSAKKAKEFEPNDDEKCVIIMNYLLYLAKKLNSGLVLNNGCYYVFNFKYWVKCEPLIFTAFLGLFAEITGIPKLKAKQYKMHEKLIRQFNTTAIFKEPVKGDIVKINLLNGTFHINNSEVSEANELKRVEKDDFLKYQLPFIYDPASKSPIFDNYLNHVLPDPDLQKVLMEYVGYLFTRGLKLEKALILVGDGANGKSVFFEVLMALLGKDNVSNYSMDNLLNDNGTYRVGLGNVLVNYCTELGNMKDMQTYKVLISGEPVSARSLYSNPIIITDYCKFIFNTNILPKVEQTAGYFRRQIIVPFNKTIPEIEQDIDLHKKIIAAELSGVFNHVLKGLERLLNQGKFTNAKAINETINEYKRDSNSVQYFLEEEGWKPSLRKKIKKEELYFQYDRFCDSNKFPPVNSVNFGKRLRALDYEMPRSTNGYYFVLCEKMENREIIEKEDEATILSLFFKDSQSPDA